MTENCDDFEIGNDKEYPVEGTAAVQAVKAGKRKKRRNNKIKITEYADHVDVINEKHEPSEDKKPLEELMNEGEKPDIPPPDLPEMPKEPTFMPVPDITEPPPPEGVPQEIRMGSMGNVSAVGEGVSTDVRIKIDGLSGSGIMYEIAEELYMKEKMQSEIEAYSRPPFKKVFDESNTSALDREAKNRTRRLAEAALAASSKEPAFLPDDVYSNLNKPINTKTAFLLQLVFMLPVVNIVTALYFAFFKNTNINIRNFSRGVVIWAAVFMTLLFVYLALFYVSAPGNRPQLAWAESFFAI